VGSEAAPDARRTQTSRIVLRPTETIDARDLSETKWLAKWRSCGCKRRREEEEEGVRW
jgi:hypothetical protein